MKKSYTIEEEHHVNPLVAGGLLTIPLGIVPHINRLAGGQPTHPLAAGVSLVNGSRTGFG